ncbi:MAG: molybdopterin biosynthesis protein [Ruminococcaceae bacterium]|nr:molybdopterin biosynthesis protein [Oscillospiraceae bacterium]
MKDKPSIEKWMAEAKSHESAAKCGMYLLHNGTVRVTPRAKVREGSLSDKEVKSLVFFYNEEKLNEIIDDGYKLEGIYYIRAWLNEGELEAGEDIMYVLIGGDIRPRVITALDYIVGRIKNECVVEKEIYV